MKSPMFLCTYVSPDGIACQESISEKGVCFWHNTQKEKTSAEIKFHLEEKTKKQQPMCGFHLVKADLSDAFIMETDLSHANLTRANLSDGHLFGINLRHANLFKANLSHANLKEAHLEGANLLGVTLDKTDLERVHWGKNKHVINHHEADILNKQGNTQAANIKYLEAEEIYRNLRKCYETAGTADIAGEFFYLEMVAKRKQMPLFSLTRMWSKLVDLLCGYGEIPYRIIFSSIIYIVFNAILFGILGLKYEGQIYRFNTEASFYENLVLFGNATYFSVVTFTTVGYGDFTPLGMARVFAATEAFNGAFMIALFILAFVKRMTR